MDDIYFANCQKCEIFLTEGVKILGTITGGFFIDQKNMMYIFKICKSSLLQVARWGRRNYLKKSALKEDLKPPKNRPFLVSKGCKMNFFSIFFLKSVKEGPGTYFPTQFFGPSH